jgi:antitoxin ParD1/3/4
MSATKPRATSVILGDYYQGFVNAQINAGRYGSTSEAIRAGLRLLEEHDTEIEQIRRALIAGEESGPCTPIDREAFKAEARARSARRAVVG